MGQLGGCEVVGKGVGPDGAPASAAGGGIQKERMVMIVFVCACVYVCVFSSVRTGFGGLPQLCIPVLVGALGGHPLRVKRFWCHEVLVGALGGHPLGVMRFWWVRFWWVH